MDSHSRQVAAANVISLPEKVPTTTMGWQAGRWVSDRRGQSAPLGMALVFAIVITSTTVIVAIGAGSITATQGQIDIQRTEKTLTQLDSKAAMVALGRSNVQQVELAAASEKGYIVTDAGRMIVEHKEGATTTTLVDRDLGEIKYEADDQTIAYQGGGVWKKVGDDTVMISPPEVHYRDATLTLPLITISGDKSLGPRANIDRVSQSQIEPPDGNPIENGKVTLTVQSDYYEGWGQYFEQRTGGKVTYDHANDEVTITLVVKTNRNAVSSPVVAGGTGTTLEIKKDTTVDSYDSSVGAYPAGSASTEIYAAGPVTVFKKAEIDSGIVADGDLTIKKKADIYGTAETTGDFLLKKEAKVHEDVSTNGDAELDKNAEIVGTLNHRGSLTKHSTATIGSTSTSADVSGIPDPEPVDGLINDKRLSYQSDNDNNKDLSTQAAITNIETGACPDAPAACELTAGNYYLSDINLAAEQKLELDTSSGDINIVVTGDITLAKKSDIEVTGDGRVNVYNEGDLELKKKVTVDNNGKDAPQFWIYMNKDSTSHLNKEVEYTGVIYGPGQGGSGGTEITIEKNGEVFGAVVGDVDVIKKDRSLHYDAALSNTQVTTQTTSLPAVTYVHISVNELKVTG
ncbi:MAG: hypothetical protein ABEH35_02810 [Haloarculaceae archaeon]